MEEFLEKLKELTLAAVCGRRFILIKSLIKWFREHPDKVANLANKAYANTSHLGLPIQPKSILHSDCLLLVFSLLLELGYGKLIHSFKRRIDDGESFSSIDNKRANEILVEAVRQSELAATDQEGLATLFERRKWRYRPALLEYDHQRDWDHEVILPLLTMESINTKGGTASLWFIDVPVEFVNDMLNAVVAPFKRKHEPTGIEVRELRFICVVAHQRSELTCSSATALR